MSARHPSEGIAFEPLTAIAGGIVGGALIAAIAWRTLWKTLTPKENRR